MLRFAALLLTALLLSPLASAHEYPDTLRVRIGETVMFQVADTDRCQADVFIEGLDPALGFVTPEAGRGVVVDFALTAASTPAVTEMIVQWVGVDVGGDGPCNEDTRPGGRTIVVRIAGDDVNSDSDTGDYVPGDGLCDTNDNVARGPSAEEPECTLRAAIEEANAGGERAIEFDIVGGPPYTIGIRSPLPEIEVPMTITGPGSTPLRGITPPQVFVSGAAAGAADGINVGPGGAGTRIRGLGIVLFGGNGMTIRSEGVVVEACYIGVLASGAAAPNGESGIQIGDGAANVIGGETPEAGNVISANVRFGVEIIASSGNRVLGNLIGPLAGSTAVRGNGLGGVSIAGTGGTNAIGGPTDVPGNAPGNHIAGGGDVAGILIENDANIVRGNLIGTASAPEASTYGIAGPGVLIEGSDNTIGGADENTGNTIAHNDSTGVTVLGSTSENNTIRRNLIYANGSLAIDLGADGATANDLNANPAMHDADQGTNDLLNFPVALTVSPSPFSAAQRIISGVVDSPNPERLIIEIYASEKPGEARRGETRFGDLQVYIDTTRANAEGFIRKVVLPAGIPHPILSATATDADGNTSEVSWVCTDTDNNGSVDLDGDGICDTWEVTGIDYDGNGVSDLDLRAAGARLDRTDVFVEADWMRGHEPLAGGFTAVVAAFAASPRRLALHVDKDEEVPLMTPIQFGSAAVAGARGTFQGVKNGNPVDPCGVEATDGHFGKRADRMSPTCPARLGARRLVYRYSLFGNDYAEEVGSSGIAELLGDDFLVTIGSWGAASWRTNAGLGPGASVASARQIIEASTFMHELGHTLGRRHGGVEDLNCKPNYPSIMSYALQFPDAIPARVMDYSRGAMANLNEGALLEQAGLNGPANRSVLYRSGGRTRISSARRNAIDWDSDGVFEAPSVSVDISNLANWCSSAGINASLRGSDDWTNLRLNFRVLRGYTAGGVPLPVDDEVRERTVEEVSEVSTTTDYDGDGFSNAEDNCPSIANPDQTDGDANGIGDACEGPLADVAVIGTVDDTTADPAVRLTVYNFGPETATDIAVADTLASGVRVSQVMTTAGTCTFEGGITECNVPTLAAGDSVMVTIDTASGGAMVTDRSRVAYTFDPNPYNDFWGSGFGSPVASEPRAPEAPSVTQLLAAYPNPVRHRATIPFALASPEAVRIAVFDAWGREVAVLVDAPMSAGLHAVDLDAATLPSGTYFVRFQAGQHSDSASLVIVR